MARCGATHSSRAAASEAAAAVHSWRSARIADGGVDDVGIGVALAILRRRRRRKRLDDRVRLQSVPAEPVLVKTSIAWT